MPKKVLGLTIDAVYAKPAQGGVTIEEMVIEFNGEAPADLAWVENEDKATGARTSLTFAEVLQN